MDIEHPTNPHTTQLLLPSKPLLSQQTPTPHTLLYALTDNTLSLLDINKQTSLYNSKAVHQARIGCLRVRENLVFSGGWDHVVNIWDMRAGWGLVHSFQRVPAKFNSIDVSEHILAAATNANIIFWDLRKMKQRSQFKQSFNGEISHIRFQEQVPTNLYGCSVDGMINMFDLTQPNQEEAFNWCYKVMESPGFFSTGGKESLLVRTLDHNLYKIYQGDQLGKISPNNSQNPRHILYSQFKPATNSQLYEYFTWSPEEKVVEHWVGSFMDRGNQEKCVGFIEGVEDPEIFDVVQQGGGCVGVWGDQAGVVRVARFSAERGRKEVKKELSAEKKSEAKSKGKAMGPGRKDRAHSAEPKLTNKNGYVLEKPVSSFANHKKFKPY